MPHATARLVGFGVVVYSEASDRALREAIEQAKIKLARVFDPAQPIMARIEPLPDPPDGIEPRELPGYSELSGEALPDGDPSSVEFVRSVIEALDSLPLIEGEQ